MKQISTELQLSLPPIRMTKYHLDPIQATFKGGAKDPLQRWYPYLEGYSPKFVRAVLGEYAPDAEVVYDPFAGVGTTPLVAAELGLTSLYSEINPLLQFLTSVKIEARNLNLKKKGLILDNLRRIFDDLEDLIKESPKSLDLQKSYAQTFGKSKYFDAETYEMVLRVRSLIDSVARTSLLTSELLTVAVVSSLIPSSLLQRYGDLRFKTTEELSKKKVDFLASIKGKLKDIISDLQVIEPLSQKPYLVTEDAKHIAKIAFLGIDTVVTSPPYLNGTNYFRNTKVELWFLRVLKTRKDLTSFRQRSVTSGINDVFDKASYSSVPNSVTKIVSNLERNAYDKRIPKMVNYYFKDMAAIFDGLKRHLRKGNTIAIDIGDSIYGNVHVPTDELLVDVLENEGYEFKNLTELRKRTSRNGSALRQVLLTFRYPSIKISKNRHNSPPWRRRWGVFKEDLSHQRYPFSKRNWGHQLHSLCSYQGKMKPSLAHHLVKVFSSPGDRILDPFAGVGTIPFEAALNGTKSYGFDISPAAVTITQAKLSKPNRKKCSTLIQKLEAYIKESCLTENEIEEANLFGFNGKLIDYFETSTLKEVLLARRYFSNNQPEDASDALVVSSLLHILHGNRPYALSRRSHGITPFSPTGKFEYKPLISHLRDKVDRSLSVSYPDNFMEGKMLFQDATTWWPQEIDNIDAIITSPPFFDSTRFYLGNWMRLWFCGWGQSDFKTKPLYFVDERQKETFDIYEPILRQGRERLRNGGVFVFHLGKSKKCDMAENLSQVAKRWFKVADVFEENVEATESHGIRDKGTVVKHQFLILN